MSEAKEKPILFNGDMVRAILDGRKTQTRRIMNPQPIKIPDDEKHWYACNKVKTMIKVEDKLQNLQTWKGLASSICPLGKIGDQLWVRETFAIVPRTAYRQSVGIQQILKPNCDHDAAIFKEGWDRSPPDRWRPSIHMPRWASRLNLKITDVRVERLQDISEEDAIAEGVKELRKGYWKNYHSNDWTEFQLSARGSFCTLWESINGPGSWDQNPWVWVIEFEVL